MVNEGFYATGEWEGLVLLRTCGRASSREAKSGKYVERLNTTSEQAIGMNDADKIQSYSPA
jgi:hypothetical protein